MIISFSALNTENWNGYNPRHDRNDDSDNTICKKTPTSDLGKRTREGIYRYNADEPEYETQDTPCYQRKYGYKQICSPYIVSHSVLQNFVSFGVAKIFTYREQTTNSPSKA
eukprot:GHVU01136000.1.p2 GENE.GHVU01136000.1~~GHVU01136000.1.p2  ORF type:complete len:111 (+),score=5.12 GHVU01136000.1:319-651(+)